jgi:ascorbate-specific PTS system EIIC-type component UlaA
MKDTLSAPDHAARSRGHSVITTLLLIMIAVMIVRDILVRRWTTTTPVASDVTQRSR